MAYTPDSLPKTHSEFGGGPGLIDPETRKDRVGMTNDELRLEVMFSNPDPPESAARGGLGIPADLEGAALDAAFESRAAAIEVENDPKTVPVPRVQIPVED